VTNSFAGAQRIKRVKKRDFVGRRLLADGIGDAGDLQTLAAHRVEEVQTNDATAHPVPVRGLEINDSLRRVQIRRQDYLMLAAPGDGKTVLRDFKGGIAFFILARFGIYEMQTGLQLSKTICLADSFFKNICRPSDAAPNAPARAAFK